MKFAVLKNSTFLCKISTQKGQNDPFLFITSLRMFLKFARNQFPQRPGRSTTGRWGPAESTLEPPRQAMVRSQPTLWILYFLYPPSNMLIWHEIKETYEKLQVLSHIARGAKYPHRPYWLSSKYFLLPMVWDTF